MTVHKRPRLKAAPQSVQRLKAKLKTLFRRGRGRNLRNFIAELAPVLRGWITYYRHAEVRGIFEELDGWMRRKLRCLIWRQWKRGRTRFKRLKALGLSEERARKSAYNGRGPWRNAGASHMNEAFQVRDFTALGLVSLESSLKRLQHTT